MANRVMTLIMVISSTANGMVADVDIEGDSRFGDFIDKYKEMLEAFHANAVEICVDHENQQNLIDIPINQKPRYLN
ncbi:hypothetical protein F9U38_15795 [Pectobacterium versatile]|uniref:hypothetical protein n=1 Tax=Pectobacterium versatile TaxID=2488639 RepID=UPI001B39D639|nr:hypothetical protein [Pectobacterium versatile]MBQ4781979.1 hypothetical protein [Pectobacterium versatile]MBQ4786439.1 hypothetical protein [Pectobacterium versatile]